ncbi:MAG: TonB-dependent receptor [Cytophagales bacterium]|nr:TonB-dependent receptor [Cytophagales bacterium]
MKKILFASLFILLGFQGIAQKEDNAYYLPDLDITDSRILERSGFKNQKIDSASIAENTASDLGELLSLQSPIFIKRQGVGGLATPSFRGTGASHTQLFWNGINLNNPMLGQVDLSLFPVFLNNKINVNFGASSLLYGTGGLGGAIRLESQPSWEKGLSVTARQYAGSFSTFATSLGIRTGNEKWNSTTKVYFKTADNDFEFTNTSQKESPEQDEYPRQKNKHAEQKQQGFLQEISRKLGRSDQITGRFWHQKNDRNLPPSMNKPSSKAVQKDDASRGILEWQHNDAFKNIIVRGAWVEETISYNNPDTNTDTKSLSTSWHLNGIFNFQLHESLYLNSGFTARKDNAKTDNYQDLESEKKVSRVQDKQDIYMNLEWQPSPRWSLSALARQQWIDGKAKPFLPSLGASVEVLNKKTFNWQTQANFSRNFHAPSLNDRYFYPVGNPNLKPEKGWNGELANRWKLKHKLFTAEYELTAFYSDIDNWIIWRPGVLRLWKPENLRRVISKGLEHTLSVQWNIGEWKMHTRINYSYISSENQKSYDGQDDIVNEQLIYVPRHNFNGFFRLRYRSWHATVEEQGYGKRNIRTKEYQNDEYLAAYWLTNINIGRSFNWGTHRVDAQLRINNFFGYHYQSVARRPMPERCFGFTIVYSFINS